MTSLKDRERMLELLADKAMTGLSDSQEAELVRLGAKFPELADDRSFDRAAAAFSLNSLKISEEMPTSLRSRIEADGKAFVSERAPAVRDESGVSWRDAGTDVSTIGFEKSGFSLSQWLGWGVAALACIALVANIWLTRMSPSGPQVAENLPTANGEGREPTLEEKFNDFKASAGDLVRTDWSSPAEDGSLEGEIVWSDDKQTGYMKFRGLPKNDNRREQYQLWIFDKTQDEATPIDGGVFDVGKDGEVIVPINAKLTVDEPKMFAVTVERPGGVVVSKREKIVALAKV